MNKTFGHKQAYVNKNGTKQNKKKKRYFHYNWLFKAYCDLDINLELMVKFTNSEHSSRRAKRVANEVSSTVENMIKEK